MTKRTIVNKLQTLGVEQFTKDLQNVTWYDTGHSIRVDFWNIDVLFPCKYNSQHVDSKMLSVEILYRKNDSIHCNVYSHYFSNTEPVLFSEFLALSGYIEFLNLVRSKQSVGLRLTKGE